MVFCSSTAWGPAVIPPFAPAGPCSAPAPAAPALFDATVTFRRLIVPSTASRAPASPPAPVVTPLSGGVVKVPPSPAWLPAIVLLRIVTVSSPAIRPPPHPPGDPGLLGRMPGSPEGR